MYTFWFERYDKTYAILEPDTYTPVAPRAEYATSFTAFYRGVQSDRNVLFSIFLRLSGCPLISVDRPRQQTIEFKPFVGQVKRKRFLISYY